MMSFSDTTYHYAFKEEINHHSSAQLQQMNVNISPLSSLVDIYLSDMILKQCSEALNKHTSQFTL